MPIKNVADFTEAVGAPALPPPPAPRSYLLNDREVSWGPPSSLDAGDAAGRLGLDMGEPEIKAAALRELLQSTDADMLVKQAWLGAVARGGLTAGKALLKGGRSLLGMGNQASKRSASWFARRRAAQKPATTLTGKAMTGVGHGFDAMDVGMGAAAVTAPAVGALTYSKQRSGGII